MHYTAKKTKKKSLHWLTVTRKREVWNENTILHLLPPHLQQQTPSQFPVPDIGIPFFGHIDLKPQNHVAQTLAFIVCFFSISKSCGLLSLSPFTAAFILTLLLHSSSTFTEASVTPHLHFPMAPSFTPRCLDMSVRLISLKHHFAVSPHCTAPKYLRPLLTPSHVKSQLFCQLSPFKMTSDALFSPPMHSSSLIARTQLLLWLGKMRHCLWNRADFCTACAFSTLECSPYPSLNSIHPSRPGLKPSSSKMSLFTTSDLANLPKFKIQKHLPSLQPS